MPPASLTKLLKRSHSGLPSLVTTIERQILVETPDYSVRAASAALTLLNDAFKTGDKFKIRLAYNNLRRVMEAPRSREDPYIHISELEKGCPRYFYYRVTHVPRSNPKWKPDPQLQMTFDVGTYWHGYLQNLLLDAGILLQDEVKVFNKHFFLIGHNDGEGVLEGVKFILEIKTINSYGFAERKKQGKAMESHMYQAGIYLEERPHIEIVIFLYVNKDTSEILEIVCKRGMFEAYQDAAYDKLEKIKLSVNKGKPPARVCDTATDKMALGCTYCNHCFNLLK